ncbi:MAG: hypothetical protein M1838_004589, partial [Thelocarpon superellum]
SSLMIPQPPQCLLTHVLADTNLSDPFSTAIAEHKRKGASYSDPYIETADSPDELLDIFNSSGDMAGAESPTTPFIKDEPEDQIFNSNQAQRLMANHPSGYGVPQQPSFGQYGTSQGSIDPSELTVAGGPLSMQNGTFAQSYSSYNSQPNLNYPLGHAGIADDELLDLANLDDSSADPGSFQHHQSGFGGSMNAQGNGMQGMFPPSNTNLNQQNRMGQGFSHTPDGGPIQSPFIQNNFNYDQFRTPQQPQQQAMGANPLGTPSSYNASPRMRPGSKPHHGLERKPSESRSPLTPKTPAMGLGGLNLGTPESGSFPTQPIHTHHLGQHRHQKSIPTQWDGTPGSMHSYVDSPLSSPGQASHHTQISDVLKSGKHASLPAKVENGQSIGPVPAYQTQEAKRRRRRESHNMVERRRRDNINERIQELSHLVPQHRLEDEKVRKHLVNNSPLSPTLGATSMSPPQATSLLAGGAGRRAAGNITTGIPIEEKDKGPNKGDILNGAVGWTRDLMWALHAKIQQESELAEYIGSLGGTFPFEQTEEEKRMRSELADAMEKNDASSFSYSRAPGTGLRVPNHTTIAGEPVGSSLMSPHSVSPTNLSGDGNNSGGHGQGQFWSGQASSGSGHNSLSFKEEDEYGMDIT